MDISTKSKDKIRETKGYKAWAGKVRTEVGKGFGTDCMNAMQPKGHMTGKGQVIGENEGKCHRVLVGWWLPNRYRTHMSKNIMALVPHLFIRRALGKCLIICQWHDLLSLRTRSQRNLIFLLAFPLFTVWFIHEMLQN